MILWAIFSIFIDSLREILGRRIICGVRDPSSNIGINSVPRKGMITRLPPSSIKARVRTFILCFRAVLRTGKYNLFAHLTRRLSFSFSAFKKNEQRTGVTNIDKTRDEKRAIATVKAKGENIFPSMP